MSADQQHGRQGARRRSFTGQIRQVLRRLGRAPMFTAVTLITLAGGIAANIVVFSALPVWIR